MEAAEKTLTYRDGPGPDKLLKGGTGGHVQTRSESNYVDLDMRPDGNKTVKVTFTGEGSQLSVKSDGSKQGEPRPAPEELPSGDSLDMAGGVADPTPAEEQDSGDGVRSELSEEDELQYTDMYLNSRTESDDGTSEAALSDHSGTDTLKDESHYITTHEIQLTELDHEVDYDLGRGASWDFEDDNLVYTFVDYASFESDDTRTGTLILEGKVGSKLGVSTEQDDSDLCDSDKCASSDESLCKDHMIGDAGLGEIHLSVKPSEEEPAGVVDQGAKHFSFVRPGPLGDNKATFFIPAPGRQHLATKLRRKDINEYSSGASSSISELDDADKEVRNLTARSFRSLACPYFDTINLSTSSESSSMSEYSLNKWSAYVDWNYGHMPRGAERSVIAHKTSSATLEMNRTLEKAAQAAKRLSVGQKAELKDPAGVTLNVQCNVEAAGTRRPKSTRNRSGEAHGAVLARSGCQMQYQQTDSTGNTQKRAIFASSLLQNVISKKMQFEHERKMERGELFNASVSPCSLEGGNDRSAALRGFQRQSSESSTGFTNSGDEPPSEGGSRPASCEPVEEQKSSNAAEEPCQRPKVVLSHSQTSAFNSWKDKGAAKEESDRSNMLTKLLFVPSWQRISKETDVGDAACQKSGTALQTGNTESESDKGTKTPEIKICLRSVKENNGGSLNIASLLTPKISSNAGNTFRAASGAKYHILSASDKIPNFTVRDIRDTKGKFQTPIYRVRDVRKLVKSSYRLVSLDNGDGKGGTGEAADKVEDKAEDKTKTQPVKQVSPSPIVIKCHSVKTHVKSPGRAPPVGTKQPNPDQAEADKVLKQRQEKFAGEAADWRAEPRVPKQAALEKLKAAVKTMEQLYVFDRNEWKRKAQPPQPITDSHVLSLIASEEQGAEEEEENFDKPPPRKTFSNKSVLHLGNSNKVIIGSAESSEAPLSVKIEPPKQGQVEQRQLQMSPANPNVTPSDSGNYLTIPGLGYADNIKVTDRTESKVCQQADAKRVFMAEYPASSIYHQHGPQTQQVLCFSPPITTLSPSTAEAGLQTQRKMLLDPTTGHYYLVDTPVQAPTKRLFDPETGQYVDVPHSPVAPMAPVAPVPPLALSPGAFAPTYMIYPGFIPSPTLLPQSPVPLEPSEKALKNTRSAKQEVKESPYYSATAEAPPTPSSARGGVASVDRKPIISITTQQGPRIIAPPSFDGTTMSFVVEHR
ncbi:uncharacterized protein C4orf54 homolog [Entelurus aequoreus]|uniref:uncharacterized protein C4orf54 homolog n=1 Tax=Entelurus aequoreus TaxID=161455 RepID=UPI002B1DA201|nr:uncharacterized protein C4orf54 homolog [Entelurus aequoreus]